MRSRRGWSSISSGVHITASGHGTIKGHWTMVKWFEQAGVRPRRVSYCNNSSVVASLVRKGLGVSLLPYELFHREVEDGSLVVLPETPPVLKPEYSVVHLPSGELRILPAIAAFAREQSLFANVRPGVI